ncbi:proteoglycan 4-like [Monomorium pharaonis]|uniref:proteoglycan 4-like n=1 Tax=Monomorium pharaonis TaxID=307658 RepID=UPI0017465C17|nr:proteoglycan 4-like [Monomorium pharaonis]
MEKPESTWSKHTVRKIYGTYSSYAVARQKLIQAEEESDLTSNTEKEEYRKKSRKDRVAKNMETASSNTELSDDSIISDIPEVPKISNKSTHTKKDVQENFDDRCKKQYQSIEKERRKLHRGEKDFLNNRPIRPKRKHWAARRWRQRQNRRAREELNRVYQQLLESQLSSPTTPLEEPCVPRLSSPITPLEEPCVPRLSSSITPLEEPCVPRLSSPITPLEEPCVPRLSSPTTPLEELSVPRPSSPLTTPPPVFPIYSPISSPEPEETPPPPSPTPSIELIEEFERISPRPRFYHYDGTQTSLIELLEQFPLKIDPLLQNYRNFAIDLDAIDPEVLLDILPALAPSDPSLHSPLL